MTGKRLKVKNESIVRDTENGALLFTNFSQIEEYKAKREKNKAKEESIKNDINNLKNEIRDLKEMLNSIIKNSQNQRNKN